MPGNEIFSCVPFCSRSQGNLERCYILANIIQNLASKKSLFKTATVIVASEFHFHCTGPTLSTLAVVNLILVQIKVEKKSRHEKICAQT